MTTDPPVTLLCLPFAGAGAAFFTPWRALARPGLEIAPLQLPGRERLLDLPPYTDLHAAADGLLSEAVRLAGGAPVALFGHCFLGAVLAYEFTRRLVDAGMVVTRLVVSAARPPWVRRPYGSAALADEDFLALVQQITGYRHEGMDVPEIRELLLPALRADFAMDETYEPRPTELCLPVPVTAISAAADRLVPRAEVAAWSLVTAASFDLVELHGGHMYLAEDPVPLLDVLADRLLPPPRAHTVAAPDPGEAFDAFAW